jgi:hypothetical protein
LKEASNQSNASFSKQATKMVAKTYMMQYLKF